MHGLQKGAKIVKIRTIFTDIFMQRIAVLILAVILAALPFHPFFSTALMAVFADAPPVFLFLISAWKEILLVGFFALVLPLMWQRRSTLQKGLLDYIIAGFVVVSLVTGVLFTGDGFPQNLVQMVWGAKYGLLFLITFVVVRQLTFTAAQKKLLFTCAMGPAALVITFGLLQKTILPEEFLVNFGYSSEYGITEAGQGLSYCHKIENRITHEEFCRIQSTLSGPNQLGAYLLVVLPLFLFFAAQASTRLLRISLYAVFVAGIAVLFLTWSRSAWIGMIAAMAALFVVQSARPFVAIGYLALFGGGIFGLFFPALVIEKWDALRPVSLAISALFLALLLLLQAWNSRRQAFPLLAGMVFPLFLGALVFIRAFYGAFFWNIILRPSSSQGHWERWSDGAYYIMQYPFGLGLGDAGPASARFARPGETGFLPESWYLQVGLESGIIGLVLFLAILAMVALQLLRRRTAESKASLLGLVGVSAACLFLHSWESSVVALTFWTLAGVALSRTDSPTLGLRVRNFLSRFFRA